MKLRRVIKIIGIISVFVALATFVYTFFLSDNNVENRKMAKRLALKAKNDIQKKIQNASDFTKKDYDALVKKITNAYIDTYNLDTFQTALFQNEMKPKKKTNSKKRTASKKVLTK